VKTYALSQRGVAGKISEFWHLYRHKSGNIARQVASVVATAKEMEELARHWLGFSLTDRDLLEIGPGQQALRLKYFSRNNRVTAVDFDVVPHGLNPADYWQMLRRNGSKRVLKTVLRKAAGIDRACWRELETQVGSKLRDRLAVIQGDAQALPWPSQSFDFVYSFSVFEHLQDPARCLEEAIRVLRPGGGLCIATHLYSSDSGAHDPRTFFQRERRPALWAHLRPAHQHEVKPNAYCNKWRLSAWEELFSNLCPGIMFHDKGSDRTALALELKQLREQGELTDYNDRELLTFNLWGFWRKPGPMLG